MPKAKVLLIEDETIIAEALQSALSQEGYSISASSFEECKKLKPVPYRCIRKPFKTEDVISAVKDLLSSVRASEDKRVVPSPSYRN